MAVTQITDENFEKEVLNSDKPVLVDFFADWCGPCKVLAPIIAKIAEEKKDQIKVVKIDAGKESGKLAAMIYRIQAYPTIKLFRNGESISTLNGLRAKKEITQWIDSALAAPNPPKAELPAAAAAPEAPKVKMAPGQIVVLPKEDVVLPKDLQKFMDDLYSEPARKAERERGYVVDSARMEGLSSVLAGGLVVAAGIAATVITGGTAGLLLGGAAIAAGAAKIHYGGKLFAAVDPFANAKEQKGDDAASLKKKLQAKSAELAMPKLLRLAVGFAEAGAGFALARALKIDSGVTHLTSLTVLAVSGGIETGRAVVQAVKAASAKLSGKNKAAQAADNAPAPSAPTAAPEGPAPLTQLTPKNQFAAANDATTQAPAKPSENKPAASQQNSNTPG